MVNHQTGHNIPIHHLEKPGLQHQMADPKPLTEEIPTEDGGYQKYKAAGKLEGKKAIITGGDSGNDLLIQSVECVFTNRISRHWPSGSRTLRNGRR